MFTVLYCIFMSELPVQKLTKFGLSQHEAQIYSALLELGSAPVTEISKLAQLNRTTGYDILERLCLYGIANRTVIGSKRFYIAEPPVRFKQFMENKKRQADQRLQMVDEILPDLQSLYKTELKPVIKFFEGREGIKNIYLHTLESKTVIYSILDLEQYLPEFDQFGGEYVQERVKRGIKERALVVKNAAGLGFRKKYYGGKEKYLQNTEYRWLPEKLPFSIATEVNIYDDKVMSVLVKPGENVALEIQSESFANSFRLMFEIAWSTAEEFFQRRGEGKIA